MVIITAFAGFGEAFSARTGDRDVAVVSNVSDVARWLRLVRVFSLLR